jgi:hypothetical protein
VYRREAGRELTCLQSMPIILAIANSAIKAGELIQSVSDWRLADSVVRQLKPAGVRKLIPICANASACSFPIGPVEKENDWASHDKTRRLSSICDIGRSRSAEVKTVIVFHVTSPANPEHSQIQLMSSGIRNPLYRRAISRVAIRHPIGVWAFHWSSGATLV